MQLFSKLSFLRTSRKDCNDLLCINSDYSELSDQIASGFLGLLTASTRESLIGQFLHKCSDCRYLTRACDTKIEHRLFHWVLSRRLTTLPCLRYFSEKLQ